jgi:hypothetical protein
MTVVSLIDDDGHEEELPEADDAVDRFLASLYRSAHPSTRAFVDFHQTKEQAALYRSAPHRALFRSMQALHSTGLLSHVAHRLWPFATWVRERILDAFALGLAPWSFGAAFCAAQCLPAEELRLVQAEDKRKLRPAQPSWSNAALYFALPLSILWWGRSFVRTDTDAVSKLRDFAVMALLSGVAAHQGFWSGLCLKREQHAAFFGEAKHVLELIRNVSYGVVRAQGMHVTARTRRRGLLLLNVGLSWWLACAHFYWAKRIGKLDTTMMLLSLTLVPVAAFHAKNGIVQ